MSDPETMQNVKSQNEEFERKYSATYGDDHPDGKKLMHDILAKRLQTVGGKQYYDSADYNKEKQTCPKGLKVPIINAEIAYIGNDRSPPNPRLSPKGRRLSSSSGSSITGSTGCCPNEAGSAGHGLSPGKSGSASADHGHGHQPNQAHHPQHIGLHGHHHLQQVHPMHPHYPYHQGNASPTHYGHGWHMPHGSQSSSSSHYSGSPLSHFHMSPLHVNTELVKPTRRLSSTSSCGEPSPLATEGMIQVAFKRPPIPGLDCEAYHGDAIQVSLHSPHSPCTLSNRGRSPSSTHFSCLSDSNSCRNSPVNVMNSSQEDEEGYHGNRRKSNSQPQGHLMGQMHRQLSQSSLAAGASASNVSATNNNTQTGSSSVNIVVQPASSTQNNQNQNSKSNDTNNMTNNTNNISDNKVPSQNKKSKSSFEKDDVLARTATLTDDCPCGGENEQDEDRME